MTPFLPNTPGVYLGLPAETYHAAPGFSHSMSQHMEPPARLKAYRPDKPTALMMLGTLAHSLILEPSKPLPRLVVPPEEYPAPSGSSLVKSKRVAAGDMVKWSWSAHYCQDWRTAQEEAGNIVLSQSDLDTALGMAEAVASNSQAAELLTDGQSEIALFGDPYGDGPFLKSRIDLAPDCEWLIDVKTVDEASKEAFQKRIFYEGWGTQAAWYLDLWNALADQRRYFGFIMVERKAPHLVATYRVSGADLAWSRQVNAMRQRLYAECLRDDSWPGWTTAWLTVETPEKWRMR